MTDFMLALIAASFLTFGSVLASVSIFVALAERADERRHRPVLEALRHQAEERLEHRSEAGRRHAAVA
ncbi:MAG TPA: hypothetical protein VN814_08710 [Caulobacteraceae bacterium]|nr:hypothetical protein [Caulobacteraceae bacterium]